MELMTADARYEKTWHQFLSELGRHPTLRLAAYLRYKHVHHRGFEKWMYRNGYSVHAAKDRLLSLRMESVATENPEAPGFLPVLPGNQQETDTQAGDILSGISLTLPDGASVSIRRGSAEAVVSFLKLYSGEGAPCSD